MENKRAQWGSTFGFLMAAVGSAVGLGNIWGFPYKMGANGGFAFLLIYLALAVFVGFVAMVAELALGRKTGKGVIATYQTLSKKFSWIGWMGALSPFLIMTFYSVLGGHCLKYMVVNLGDLFLFVVKFILHIADNRFQQVLHGYDTGDTAIFVHHDSHLQMLFIHLLEEIVTLLGVRNKVGVSQ